MDKWPKPRMMYGIMSFSYVKQKTLLHAVDSTERMARAHEQAVRSEYKMKSPDERVRVWVEKFESNHLFASALVVW